MSVIVCHLILLYQSLKSYVKSIICLSFIWLDISSLDSSSTRGKASHIILENKWIHEQES
jgi:hypothetical protein